MAEMKDAKKTFAAGDKASRPKHPFAKTDLSRRIDSPRFKVKNVWSKFSAYCVGQVRVHAVIVLRKYKKLR